MAKETARKWNWDLFDGSKNKDEAEIDMTEAEKEKLSELMDRAIPLIEQVNSMYNQYRQGTEKRPPRERHNVLESVITSIQYLRKPTASARFRTRQIVSKYMAYKDRWDRIVKAMEMGRDLQNLKRQARSYRKPGDK